jgi:hypothetical protein
MPATTTAATIRTLDYASGLIFYRTRRFRRLLVLASVALCLVVPSLIYGRAIEQQITLLYRQHRCLTHRRPPDLVVFNGSADDRRTATFAGKTQSPTTAPADPEWVAATFGLYFPVPAHRRSLDWERFVASAGLTYRNRSSNRTWPAVLFLHERRNAGGRRLVVVCVDVFGTPNGPPPKLVFSSTVVIPAGLTGKPTLARPSLHFHRFVPPPPARASRFGWVEPFPRFYAGQADPQDPARFTVRFDLNDSSGFMDGRLQDDDSVTLTCVFDQYREARQSKCVQAGKPAPQRGCYEGTQSALAHCGGYRGARSHFSPIFWGAGPRR